MRHLHRLGALIGAMLFGSAAQAAGSVAVSFIEPARYSDVRDAQGRSDANLGAVRAVLEASAAPHVGNGQTLRIEVLDVDLAGEVRRGGPVQSLRVLRGSADWPRIELRYVLETPGQAPTAGRATVQDMNYLQRPSALRSVAELPYERRMLDDWFREVFRASATN